MRIYKARIHKRTIDIWGKKRKGRGAFIPTPMSYTNQAPTPQYYQREYGIQTLGEPIVRQNISQKNKRKAEEEKRRQRYLKNLRYQAFVEHQKTNIQEAKAKRRRISTFGAPIKKARKVKARRARYSSYDREMTEHRNPVGYRYNVASGEYEPIPRGHYNIASGEWE